VAFRVVVIGSGMAGLTAARLLAGAGHDVVVLDKGRRPGGRMATEELAGGARADKGAQFFTVRSPALDDEVDRWVADGLVHPWCSGFGSDDGHPRFVVTGGMARLPAYMSRGLDVRQSVTVDTVQPVADGWLVCWPESHGGPAGAHRCDAVVVTAPVPQAASLLGDGVPVPDLRYDATLSLVLALDGPTVIPAPGGVQMVDHPVWSWVGDNVAKGVSDLPALTLHSTAALATARWEDESGVLTDDLIVAAGPWLGDAGVVAARLQRWRYATPTGPHPERCLEVAPGIVLAGDAFGGPRIEGAFLSGVAAVEALGR